MTARKADTHSICTSLYQEMRETNRKLDEFISTIEHSEGKTRTTLNPYLRHLYELKGFIDWKLEIFSKVCPVDWGKEVENIQSTVSVKASDETDFPAGGYIGG